VHLADVDIDSAACFIGSLSDLSENDVLPSTLRPRLVAAGCLKAFGLDVVLCPSPGSDRCTLERGKDMEGRFRGARIRFDNDVGRLDDDLQWETICGLHLTSAFTAGDPFIASASSRRSFELFPGPYQAQVLRLNNDTPDVRGLRVIQLTTGWENYGTPI
jgi:hypothetical protein